MTVVGQVEIDPFCRKVLAKHWPHVERHDDVRSAVKWWQSADRPRVDAVAGGFPCQPVSEAGLKLAQEDSRWLWPAMAEVIAILEPEWVIGENVPGLLNRGVDVVVGDLERLRYRVRVGTLSACSVGAPHARSRVFILAHAVRSGCKAGSHQSRAGGGRETVAPTAGGWLRQTERPSWWTHEPRVGRVAYGVPAGVDRRRALGDAVVPQVAEHIGRLVMGAVS